MPVNLSFPQSKPVLVKSASVTRSMTAGTDAVFVLPAGAKVLAFILSGTASDAGTSATLSVGTTSGTPTEYVNAQSVLAAGAGNGVNVLKGVTGALASKLTADKIVYVKYEESGTASTAGSWTLHVVYTLSSSRTSGVDG